MSAARADRPPAAIIVPTHDHPHTLDLAVRSALAQTVREIEVIVVGDGVGDDTREVVGRLAEADPRVRFLDLPKGPNHGETHRGTAIESTQAEIICYLCDDDLLLPGHVESMAGLLADADLAHSQNGYLEPDGTWHPYFADLESPRCREWLMRPEKNAVSLTGTAHTVDSYRRLPHGWRTTPPGRWPDHYMWQQFLAEPWVRAVTATRVKALQFPSHMGGRESWPAERRRAELEEWAARLGSAEGRAELEETVLRGIERAATATHLRRDELEEQVVALEAELEAVSSERDYLDRHFRASQEQLAEIRSTKTWRLRARLGRLGF